METSGTLSSRINRVSGKGYKAYKDIKGEYEYEREGFSISIDYVQGDPFASPSKIRVRVPQDIAGFPQDTFSNKSREIATRDYLTRQFDRAIRRYARGSKGTGKSGAINIDRPGQEILERTSLFIDNTYIEARFTVGLPAFGRKIAGREAHYLFFTEIPDIVDSSLMYENINQEALYTHIYINEDADFLRNQLRDNQLVSFIANNSVLPRSSGIDPSPLRNDEVVPFESPESFMYQFNLPNAGEITGMGIPQGISLIVGGGFHGKSTMLEALEQGVYNHIPEDGREFVVTVENSVKIRSEDGRRIEKVDISPFINNLPYEKSTTDFSSDNASGSTSQAANIMETLEMDTHTLLIDEDTTATNFMIRDGKMQQLIAKENEPITPFIDKIRQLYEEHQVSTILVMGGSGDYFDKADNIIGLHNYKPYNYTEIAHKIADSNGENRKKEGGETFGTIKPRIPDRRSIDASKGKKQKRIRVNDPNEISFGKYTIDLTSAEQLIDKSQTNAIGEAIVYAARYMDGKKSLKEVIDNVFEDIENNGLNVVGARNAGNYAYFRKQDLAIAINRLRSLHVLESSYEYASED